MEKKVINIDGMTCNGCQTSVEKVLYSFSGIQEVNIELESGIGSIKGESLPSDEEINEALQKAGSYSIQTKFNATEDGQEASNKSNSSYKPLVIVLVYLLGISLVIELASGMFLWQTWMPNFMAGFFITFSFFKMLDIRGFANAYQSYDLIAGRFRPYGFFFPFIELTLGFSYILFPDNPLTHLITAIIMFVSLLGVVLAVTNKRKIQCACLGTVFNLPMSYVTIIEDGTMLLMAVLMFLSF